MLFCIAKTHAASIWVALAAGWLVPPLQHMQHVNKQQTTIASHNSRLCSESHSWKDVVVV